ncbi:hypothetical protein Tco_0741636 [Tanacetum coccineum]
MPNVDIPLGMDTGGSPRRQETMGGAPAQTRPERVLKQPNEPPLSKGHTSGSREGRMEHTFELMYIVPPTPYDSPLLGGYTPRSNEGRLKLEELIAMYTKLSKQVLYLEKEKDAQAVEILKLKKRDKKLERQRKSSISHPRRRIYMQVKSSDDDLDEEDTSKQGRTSDKIKPMFKDSDFDDLDDLVDEGMDFVQEKDAENQGKIGADDTEAVNTAAQTLKKMKEEKAKEKGVAIKDETKPIEHTKKMVQGDAQIERDAEIALRLQAELDAELRVERERQEEASKVQEEAFKLAAERAEAIRSKPPTKTQLRNLMMTYLKNMGGYKHSQLKGKSYEEIQGLYERQQKRIQDFTPMDSEKEAQKSAKRLKRVTRSYAT